MIMTTRRDFLRTSLLGAAGLTLAPVFKLSGASKSMKEKSIMTVTGPISLAEAGTFLTHEHILSRFGLEPAEPPVYDNKKVYKQVVPYLKYLKSLGIQTIADCTTAYFGRDAGILKELSRQSGMQIVANTGFYGAANDRYVPSLVSSSSPEKIAQKWIDEFNNGIEESIKPGFIKTAIDGGGMSDTDRKLVEAAAITSKETGLSIAVHTGGNLEGARKEMDIFRQHGVNLNSWIWVHAQGADTKATTEAARKGAWISIDDLRQPYYDLKTQKPFESNTLEKDLKILLEFKKQGLLNRVLLSHDGTSYPPEGTMIRHFDVLVKSFVPMMKAAGFTDDEVRLVTIENPARAMAIG